jgi:DNA-binding transcriptional ArsR family regulator
MVLNDRISPDKLLSAVNMLKVIAHPTRLAIVDLLATEERLTVLEIQERLNIEQAVASQHLTLMQDKGVLISEKIGRNKFVSLKYPKMMNIVECIEGCCNSEA